MTNLHGKRNVYIPAMHYHWLTPLYDVLVEWTLPDRRFKEHLLRQAGIQAGETILDLGCGTGTLALLVKSAHPDAEVIGLDMDPQILRIARRKTREAGAEIALHLGTAASLPYPDRSVDRVLSSFVLHHLSKADKQRAAAEVFRILRPGGELHVLDFGKPHNAYALLVSYFTRWGEELLENVQGLLPDIFRGAGFNIVEESAHFSTLFGTVSLYRARKP